MSPPIRCFGRPRGWARHGIWKWPAAHVAFEKIAGFNDPFNAFHYFINVSPPVFNDPRFTGEITKERLRQYGIDRRQIVIEITEEKAIHDYERFQTLINHYSHEGFNIALDDFGSGHSGLITLVASTPHYLKLDMAIVRDVHKHDYKQNWSRPLSLSHRVSMPA